MDIFFILNSMLLGVGLAMDAFSVSLANGLGEPKMRRYKMTVTAGAFAFFQAFMPMLGWWAVHTIISYFTKLQFFIPFIALGLLGYIGGGMLITGIKNKGEGSAVRLTPKMLLVQAIATSIDALSVGFAIADYGFTMALVCSLLIAAVTFVICIGGLIIGKRFGHGLSGKASILGGLILIFIGLEIFVKGVFL